MNLIINFFFLTPVIFFFPYKPDCYLHLHLRWADNPYVSGTVHTKDTAPGLIMGAGKCMKLFCKSWNVAGVFCVDPVFWIVAFIELQTLTKLGFPCRIFLCGIPLSSNLVKVEVPRALGQIYNSCLYTLCFSQLCSISFPISAV